MAPDDLPAPPDRKGGWYPDPEGSGKLRWWGGQRWSDRFSDEPTTTSGGGRSSPAGVVDKDERKQQRRAEKEERKRQQQAEKEEAKRKQQFQAAWNGFWASPAGQARHAFNVGDHVFQYHVDVMSQQAIIVAMVGSNTKQRKADPTSILNSVCREGWELVNGDFVFVMTGQQSRDKFLSSGQNVAVAGTVMGYYVFKRCESNRVPETEDELRTRLAS